MTTEAKVAAEEKLANLIGGINNLPTPPIVYTQIQKVLSNPNTSAYDIGSILQEDPAISARVLKMTNSAYYGLSRTIESVKQAVVIVGLEAIKTLVLSVSVMDAFKSDQIDQEFQDYFWRHSLGTAFAARLLAHTLRDKQTFDPESGFSAGLLHDIGKMVISVYMTDEMAKIKELKDQNPGISDYLIEEKVIGYNHTLIGNFLARHWKLPEKLQDAIKFHHDPTSCEVPDNNLPHLINMANYLYKFTFDTDPEDEESFNKIEPIPKSVLESVGVTDAKIRSYADKLREEFFKAETFMEMTRS